MSLNAQNEKSEILQMMALLHGIASDIAESGYYSFMADESTDVSNIEQFIIYLRWVDKEMTVCEEYIGRSDASYSDKWSCCTSQETE